MARYGHDAGMGKMTPGEARNLPTLSLCSFDRFQPHGVVIVADSQTRTIERVSSNVYDHTGLAPDTLIGASLEILLTKATDKELKGKGSVEQPTLLESTQFLQQQEFCVSVHVQSTHLVIELEPAGADADHLFELVDCEEPQDLTATFQRLTGYDRVLLCQFFGSHQTVIRAEARASDNIPSLQGRKLQGWGEQDRFLLQRMHTRMLARTSAEDVGLLPKDIHRQHLDFSCLQLRGTTPAHRASLEANGIVSAFALAIGPGDGLPGAIVAHHFSNPCIVTPRQRQRLAEARSRFATVLTIQQ